MASKIVGRSDCPECGFASAHVKESDKCLYRYCPECGSQHHARTERQRADLLKKTRLTEASPTPTPTGATAPTAQEAPAPTATPSDPSPTPPKRRGLFT